MDKFFDGYFMRYGLDVIRYSNTDGTSDESHVNPFTFLFPRMSMCTFKKFGSSGQVSEDQIICLLPINIMNEKIFIFLWFWFFTLTGMTIAGIIYHTMLCFLPKFR